MKRESIRGRIGEIVVVVIGILLAVSVDSAWQSAQDRQLAKEVLSGIAAATQNNRALLEARIDRRERKLDATHELLLWATDPSLTIPPDSIGVLVSAIRVNQRLRPDDSRIRELITSGRMHLIHNEDLRALLAGWDAEFTDLAAKELDSVDNRKRIVSWLNPRVPLDGGGLGRLDRLPRRAWTATDTQMLRVMDLENMLRRQFFLDSSAQLAAMDLLVFFDEMLGLVAAEAD